MKKASNIWILDEPVNSIYAIANAVNKALDSFT